MNLEKLREKEYECTCLLASLVGSDADTEDKIYKYFHNTGIKNYFLHLKLIGLPQERICQNISRSRIYRVLKELKEKGFIKEVEVG